MKLRTKIILGFLLTCIVFLVLSLTVYVFLRPVQSGSKNLEENVLLLLADSSKIEYHAAMEAAELRGFLINNDPRQLTLASAHEKEVEKAIKGIEDNFSSPNGYMIKVDSVETPFNTLKAKYADYQVYVEKLAGNQDKLVQGRAKIMEAHKDFTDTIVEFLKHEQDSLDRALDDEQSQAVLDRRVERVDMIRDARDNMDGAVLAIVRSVVEGNDELRKQSITLLDQALSAAKKVSEGSGSDTSKQLSSIILADIQSVIEASAALKTDMDAIAADNANRAGLTTEVITQAERLNDAGNEMAMKAAAESVRAVSRVIWTLGIGFLIALAVSLICAWLIAGNITGPVNRLIEALNDGAHEVDNASGQLSQASNTLAEGATENAASLEETSAALEELSSMTRRNSDNAMEANALMHQATEAVEKAHNSMEGVIKAMEEISVSGNEIGKIIKTIDEIAFQTNLLALNAAVEAARAGEAGAGFAVVADEVRNLAIRSADAAKNTADLIASTIGNINSGSEMVNSTAETFQTVQTHSSKVAELLAEVAEASKEQSQGIGQITTAMTQMDKVTQSNAASAEESASAAGQLSLQAGNLLGAVDEMTSLVHGLKTSASKPSRPSGPVRQLPTRPRAQENKALPMKSQTKSADDDDFDFFS